MEKAKENMVRKMKDGKGIRKDKSLSLNLPNSPLSTHPNSSSSSKPAVPASSSPSPPQPSNYKTLPTTSDSMDLDPAPLVSSQADRPAAMANKLIQPRQHLVAFGPRSPSSLPFDRPSEAEKVGVKPFRSSAAPNGPEWMRRLRIEHVKLMEYQEAKKLAAIVEEEEEEEEGTVDSNEEWGLKRRKLNKGKGKEVDLGVEGIEGVDGSRRGKGKETETGEVGAGGGTEGGKAFEQHFPNDLHGKRATRVIPAPERAARDLIIPGQSSFLLSFNLSQYLFYRFFSVVQVSRVSRKFCIGHSHGFVNLSYSKCLERWSSLIAPFNCTRFSVTTNFEVSSTEVSTFSQLRSSNDGSGTRTSSMVSPKSAALEEEWIVSRLSPNSNLS